MKLKKIMEITINYENEKQHNNWKKLWKCQTGGIRYEF